MIVSLFGIVGSFFPSGPVPLIVILWNEEPVGIKPFGYRCPQFFFNWLSPFLEI